MKKSDRRKNATLITPSSTISEADHAAQVMNSKQRKTAMSLYALSAGCFAILAFAVSYLHMKVAPLSSDSKQSDEWSLDNDFYKSSKSDNVKCDFPIIQAKSFDKKRQKNIDDLLDHPFIIRGMMSNWPANERWSKGNFTRLFGNKKVKLGSESSIVYSGGSTTLHSNLYNVLQDMHQCTETIVNTTNGGHSHSESTHVKIVHQGRIVCDSFLFDVSILRSIPELGRDFRVPGEKTLRKTSRIPTCIIPICYDIMLYHMIRY